MPPEVVGNEKTSRPGVAERGAGSRTLFRTPIDAPAAPPRFSAYPAVPLVTLHEPPLGSAGFQTCCIADFQIGTACVSDRSASLETRDTADLEVCATSQRGFMVSTHVHFLEVLPHHETSIGAPTALSARIRPSRLADMAVRAPCHHWFMVPIRNREIVKLHHEAPVHPQVVGRMWIENG